MSLIGGGAASPLDDELNEQLRDGLKALQVKEQALIDELGDEDAPDRQTIIQSMIDGGK